VEIKTSSCPGGRLCHSGVVYNDKMYIFGGHITQPQSEYFHTVKQDMYEYDYAKREWAELPSEGSPRRTEHTAVVCGDEMVVFGGYSGTGYENTAMAYNFLTNSWQQLETKGQIPSARSAHTAVLVGNTMYVYGGWNGVHCMNDLHALDLATRTWTTIEPKGNGPCSRCSHGAAIIGDGADAVMYVFGGYAIEKSNDQASRGYLNDLYEYRIATNEWVPVNYLGIPPCPRSRFRLLAYNDGLYLFAGWNSQAHFGNLFKFSCSAGQWTEITTNFETEGIGQFSMVVYKDVMYVFSGFTPKVGNRSTLFAYPLGYTVPQAR
jgi:N-acetylneuraminic acid mutarotase